MHESENEPPNYTEVYRGTRIDSDTLMAITYTWQSRGSLNQPGTAILPESQDYRDHLMKPLPFYGGRYTHPGAIRGGAIQDLTSPFSCNFPA